jgi:hypothetical protein
MQKLVVFIFFLMAFSKCNTCDDCETFAEEPFLKIRFYKADSTRNIVIIDSINHVWAGNYDYYQDTVNTYVLPLNMNADESNFVISYRDTTEWETTLTNTLNVTYARSYIKRTDNNIVQQLNIIEATSDFTTKNLLCGDSLNITCISNDALYQIYR